MSDRIRRGVDPHRLTFDFDFATIDLLDPKDALDHLGASCSHQTGQPQNLAAAQIKANAVDNALAGQVAHRQDHLANRCF